MGSRYILVALEYLNVFICFSAEMIYPFDLSWKGRYEEKRSLFWRWAAHSIWPPQISGVAAFDWTPGIPCI